MKIEIKNLTLNYFKGIRQLSIDFDHETNIYGDNATGKTTVFDAFLWLLFGKDSTDRKDFEIKTLDEKNQPFHGLDHEVCATLIIDGDHIVIKRSLREKWVKKRGAVKEEFTGHETAYFWNDVPMKLEDYQAKISGILNESVFKLITNTTYFNSMKWQDRRNVLLQIAGNISDSEILDKLSLKRDGADFSEFIKAMSAKKTVEEFKRELYAKKKKIKDELLLIPSRIDEANRALALLPVVNEPEIENNIKVIKLSITSIDNTLMDKTKAEREHQEKTLQKIREIGDLKNKIISIESGINNSVIDKRRVRESVIAEAKRTLGQYRDELNRLGTDIRYQQGNKEKIASTMATLRAKWNDINNEQLPAFDENSCKCPTCKRVLENVNIEEKKLEFQKNFNADKSKRLTEIKDRGTALGNEVAAIDKTISDLKAKADLVQIDINTFTERVNNKEIEHVRMTGDEKKEVDQLVLNSPEIGLLTEKIKALESEISTPSQDDNKAELMARKSQLAEQLNDFQRQLGNTDNRKSLVKRIEELHISESTMNQELSNLEQSEYAIELFTKAKMDELENRINGRFHYVSFKLFDTQINGGEVECCDTLIKGVPYSDANTASKINAGLDIINVLSDHYGVTAPVFIDNRESVVKLIPTSSQIVNLIVSSAHKKLTVSTAEMAMAV